MNKPYVYLIAWPDHDIWYVGLRVANKTPATEDLWIRYFTSSKRVAEARAKYGEPEITEVLQEFETRQEAADCEREILSQNDVPRCDNSLNACVVTSDGLIRHDWGAGRKKSNPENYRKPKSKEHRANISKALTGRKRDPKIFEKVVQTKIERYGAPNKPRDEESRKKTSDALKKKFQDPEFKRKWAAAQPKYLVECPCCGFKAKPNVLGNHKKKCFRENNYNP